MSARGLELFFEEPDREDPRVRFEREDLFVVFELDFDDVRRFDPLLVRPLLERLDPD